MKVTLVVVMLPVYDRRDTCEKYEMTKFNCDIQDIPLHLPPDSL